MLDEINSALEDYEQKWQALISVRHERRFFGELKPTAVGWKVVDIIEYKKYCAALHDKADKVIETWMNNRWIAEVHLRDTELANEATIIKIMQRRPESSDAIGLDHVDFYTPNMERAESVLKAETDLGWSWENNDAIADYNWLSVWFNDTEAKLKDCTVFATISQELNLCNQKIIDK